MIGAEAVLRTLADSGVRVCFANPGTSELHLAAAFDTVREVRGVLALFEGVATGAADGYARMADRPAATLLHLGPGLANGLANLHNAKRAHTPVVNLVGDNAAFHKRFDTPLESDIHALAATVSRWTRSATPATAGEDVSAAVAAARSAPGGVATLVIPADVSWAPDVSPAPPAPIAGPSEVGDAELAVVAGLVSSGAPVAFLLGGSALRAHGLRAAARIRQATGAKLFAEPFPARFQRGAGLPLVDQLASATTSVAQQLVGVAHLVLLGAKAPVAAFGSPDSPTDQVPHGCAVHVLADPAQDSVGALEALADRVAAGSPVVTTERAYMGVPDGELTVPLVAAVLAAVLPDGAVVVEEANSSAGPLLDATESAACHDLLTLGGFAIGFGLPVAAGAALASPDRPVVCLQADGSAMYTLSALWTQARERLNVTTILINNRSYAILRREAARLGCSADTCASELFDLSRPDLDFVQIARGMGVAADRACSAGELARLLRDALAEPGAHLIEVCVPPLH